MQKCGYVVLLGRPNAGKSTLLNACVGFKLASVSKKPQTTRNRILGITHRIDSQVIFIDTPGLHRAKGMPRIHAAMNQASWNAASEADIVCYLIDIKQGFHSEDKFLLEKFLKRFEGQLIFLGSKSDKIKKKIAEQQFAEAEAQIKALGSDLDEKAQKILVNSSFHLISAKRPDDIDQLTDLLAQNLPQGPWLFAADDLTDQPENFIVAEMIREQLFRQLGKEIPYGTGVVIDGIDRKDNKVEVMATIFVNKASHKSMVIGKGGSRIKEIGIEARKSLETFYDLKVFLDLHVNVQENWIDRPDMIASIQRLEEF